MKSLKERILDSAQQDLEEIETALVENLKPYLPLVSHIARYIMFSGGKRIRPLLTVLSARLCGYEGDYDKTLSVVFEYLHAATLLHDDIVDSAEIRRGNPVAHLIWGSPAPVLVGDFLFACSSTIVTHTGHIAIIDTLARTHAEMSQGEIEELLHTKDATMEEGQYMEIIKRKTAWLMRAACQAGALLAGAPEHEVEALAQYGYNLGVAFQLVDDLLDYTADRHVLGKATGGDLREGKLTLPLIHALSRASTKDRSYMETIIQHEEIDEKDVDNISKLISKYGGFTYTRRRAEEYINNAKSYLEVFDSSEARCLLEDLANYVLERNM